jgi:hypothetical protein
VGGEKKRKNHYFLNFGFQSGSQENRRVILNLYFISTLFQDLAKSS